MLEVMLVGSSTKTVNSGNTPSLQRITPSNMKEAKHFCHLPLEEYLLYLIPLFV